MSHVLVVLGSVRKGRVADAILGYVQNDLSARPDTKVTVADLKEVTLPFFDNEISPASPEYAPTNPAVLAWTAMVAAADSVLFITPEYNHTLTAVQKNAIDTLYKEWASKPMAAVAYGWTGGSRSIETLQDLIPHVGGIFTPNPAQLTFMKDINPDGSAINQAAIAAQIKATIDEIV